MSFPRYRKIQNELKVKIQKGVYEVGDYLPSENELCSLYKITRTTARKALDELTREGFIERRHGKGSKIIERRKTLGLLSVKGFSEAVGENVKTRFLVDPHISDWDLDFPFQPSDNELKSGCIKFDRIRYVGADPVMVESNWFSVLALPDFMGKEFIEDSFFKTLSQRYLIEIIGSDQELRALTAETEIANLLNLAPGSPLLNIALKFKTSRSDFNIYSRLFCNTLKFPIGNSSL